MVPTALVSLNSDKLGQQYQNDIFVGSVKNRTIYNFDLNEDRKSLSLDGFKKVHPIEVVTMEG